MTQFSQLAEDELRALAPGLKAIATFRIAEATNAVLDEAAAAFRAQLETTLRFTVTVEKDRDSGAMVLTVKPGRNMNEFSEIK